MSDKRVLCKVKSIEVGQFLFQNNNKENNLLEVSDQMKYDIESQSIKINVGVVANIFLYLMKGEFMIENTEVINTALYDSDTYQNHIVEKTQVKSNSFKLGSFEKIARFGSNIFSMSRSHFHSISTKEGKLSYIADQMYLSLMRYCNYFEQNSSPLNKAYEEIKSYTDWYFPKEGGSKSLNKEGTHKIWLQTLYGYDKNSYRLAVQSVSSLEKKYYFITEKDPWVKIVIENNLKEAYRKGNSEGTPAIRFNILGWKKKGTVFQFKWGEEEFYEFSLKTMELVRK